MIDEEKAVQFTARPEDVEELREICLAIYHMTTQPKTTINPMRIYHHLNNLRIRLFGGEEV